LRERVTIVGSGLDALVAVHELSKSHVNVEWLSPTNRIGGHFAGWQGQCGELVDIGMVALEKDVRDSLPRPMTEYSGQVHADARPFLWEMFDALLRMGLDPIPLQIAVLDGEQEVGDYFISDDLSALSHLIRSDRLGTANIGTLRARLGELQARQLESQLRSKSISADLGQEGSLLEVLRRTWGRELSRFLFEDFLREIDPDGLTAARDHRLVWTPLYWPSSIEDELARPGSLPTLPCLGHRSGSVATFIQGLLNETREQDSVMFSVDLSLTPTRLVSDEPAILRVDLRPLPTPSVNRSAIRIVHFCASHGLNKSEFVRSPQQGCFRLNWRSGPNSESVSLEFGVGVADLSDEDCVERAAQLLRALNVTSECPGSVVSGRVPLALPRLDYGESEFSPLSSRFGQNMGLNFNESVLRGLATAGHLLERLGER
jgi:hypothetical protein